MKPNEVSGVVSAVGGEFVMPAAGLCGPVRAATRRSAFEDRSLANDLAMARYAAGDDAAFSSLYEGLCPLITAYLRRRFANPAVVEDLVQETFLRIHLHRGRYKLDAPVLPWALTIAARLLANRLRGARRADAVFCGDERVCDGITEIANPEEIAIGAEFAEQLEKELQLLSPVDRAAFDLVKCNGVPLSVAAPQLGLSLLALKMRLFRICRRLRVYRKLDEESPKGEK
jgi:RNA polymerase sigma-70 factor (ECF subfamily)